MSLLEGPYLIEASSKGPPKCHKIEAPPPKKKKKKKKKK